MSLDFDVTGRYAPQSQAAAALQSAFLPTTFAIIPENFEPLILYFLQTAISHKVLREKLLFQKRRRSLGCNLSPFFARA